MRFLLFLACAAVLSALTPLHMRWVLLLCASILFYVFLDAANLAFLVATCIVDYGVGRCLGSCRPLGRKWLLGLSLLWNLGVLISFKYAAFILRSLALLPALFPLLPTQPFVALITPIGLSFYTFRSLSYVFDVYRGTRAPERHLGHYALYVTFFPTLLAGPIDRSSPFIDQLKNPLPLQPQHLSSAFRALLFGGFLKYVIADNLAVYVNAVYGDVHAFMGPQLVLATYFFSVQIFCDFAGYSLIALGAARLLGIEVIDNFRRPYLATSVGEFWNRWHISLSRWLRDYVYFPLGGSRASLPRTVRNLLITFLVSGLWHGASWTFVLWGALHGACMAVERCFRVLTGKKKGDAQPSPWKRALQILVTFHVVTAAWVFFRAGSVSDALYVFGHLFSGWSEPLLLVNRHITIPMFVLSIVLSALLMGTQVIQEARGGRDLLQRWPRPLRWSVYYAVLFGILFLQANTVQDFIYLQF